MSRWLTLVLLMFLAPSAVGASPMPDLRAFAYEQKLGNALPLQSIFREADGRDIRLVDVIGGRPLILALAYFRCPNLCGVVRADLFEALAKSGMVAGADYSLVVLSIDPEETDADAQAAMWRDLAGFDPPGTQAGWHYLTGTPGALQAIEDAVGFHSRLDPGLRQFMHPAGLVFATPSGLVSSYLLGVGYQPADVRLAVARAGQSGIAGATLPVLLLCFHYDPTTGRYSLAVMKLLRLGAVLTALTVAGTLFLAFRRERAG
jgi:protein SCO1/2